MQRSIQADIIVYFFILLFFYTGAAKLTEIQTFRQEPSSSPFMANITAWALPMAEVPLAIALVIPKTHLKALYVTAGLMTLSLDLSS